MAKINVLKGTTSKSQFIYIQRTDGSGATGISATQSGLAAYYIRPQAALTQISLVTTTGSATMPFNSGGLFEVGATAMPGLYRFDVPNAVFATGASNAIVELWGSSTFATLIMPVVMEFQLTGYDPDDLVLQSWLAQDLSGTATAGSTTTLEDAILTAADTDYYKNSILLITSGNLSGQARRITAFTPANDRVTVSPAFTQTTNGLKWTILPDSAVDNISWLGTALSSPSTPGVPLVTVSDLSSAAIASIWNQVVSGTTTCIQAMRGFCAALLGKVSGGSTTTNTFRDIADSKDVIVATVDSNNNRTAITRDLT